MMLEIITIPATNFVLFVVLKCKIDAIKNRVFLVN